MEDRNTPIWKIFHNYYEITMPQHHLYSQEYIETFGIPTSGDVNVDREMGNSPINARRTIAQIADLLSEGADITINKPDLSSEIYQCIRDYLREWQVRVNSSPVAIDVPLEDLQKLEFLAESLLPMVKETQVFVEKVSAFDAIGGIGFNKPTIQLTDTKKNSQDNGYQSITQAISKEAFRKQKNWE